MTTKASLLLLLLRVCNAFNLTILHMNDHHSHLVEEDFDIDVSSLDVNATEVSVKYGGFPRLVTLLNSYEEGNVLKLHAGDALVGTPLYSIYKGDVDALLMQALCLDAFCLGNHEFDDGDANLAEFLTALVEGDECSPAVLAANVVPGAESPLAALKEDEILQESTVIEMEGEQIGIIGINIRNKTLTSSQPDPGTSLLDERETATTQVEALTAMGINKIVLLTHIGFDFDKEWMAEIPGVDVVVGGDSHTLLGDADSVGGAFAPVDSYPAAVTASDGRVVCVAQAWEFAHGIGQLDVTFDDDGNVESCMGLSIFPFDSSSYESDTVLAETDGGSITEYLSGLPSFVETAKDPDADALLTLFTSMLDEQLQQVIATVPEDICFERIPGQGRSTICSLNATSTQGGGVCNLVAIAFLEQTPTAHASIQNGGGCRTDIASGNFTFEDAYLLLPFSNTLVTLEMTGEQIKTVLEQALENALVGGSTGAYPYAAGLRYDVDANEPMGSRIGDIEINVRLAEETWSSIDSGASYTIVTNSFISEGRDGYLEFIEAGGVLNTQQEYAQSFIDYAEDVGVLEDPPLGFYSTKSYIALEEGGSSGSSTALSTVFTMSLQLLVVTLFWG